MLAAVLALMLSSPSKAAAAVADPGAADWRPIPDDELLVMTLASGGTVVIRLAPVYAPEHVANVRRLALAHWWDRTTVYRVQDNWVTQWGGQPADAPDDPANKPLPAGVPKVPAAEYEVAGGFRPARLLGADAYAGATGITADGWAVGTGAGTRGDGGLPSADAPAWLTHCYGTVGVARDASPDTGSGSELFMPIGGSARRLDRNYAIVGRVIEGAGYLAALPRGAAPAGMYDAAAGERVMIETVRLASDLPAATRPHFAYLRPDSERFAATIEAKRHPKGMVAPAGLDVCDVPLATRRTGG